MKEAGVWSVMSAYNRLNGTPCSMNKWLLEGILREHWGFSGHIVCDCGAIHWIWAYHKSSPTVEEACAQSVKAGCDLECGTQFLALLTALKLRLVSEPEIDQALRRILEIRFRLGMFDPAKMVPYAQIPATKIDCAEHGELALQAARESIVLLKNDGVLPLAAEKLKRIAVVGGNADLLEALVGNYNGTPSHPVTILEGIKRAAPGVEVIYAAGCPLVLRPGDKIDDSAIREALELAGKADCIIYSGGITGHLEGESGDGASGLEGFLDGDRTRIELPAQQTEFLKALHATGKSVVFVHCGGGAVAMEWEAENLPAIVQAWYPGQEGGTAVADVLFGKYNPAGRLPVTFYRSTADLPPFEDYNMANRTYRYFTGKVLFPFGYGLSYTTFQISGLTVESTNGDGFRLKLTVHNTGPRDGDEVVQIYARNRDTKEAVRRLVGFRRVGVPHDGRVNLDLDVSFRELRSWDDKRGDYIAAPGTYEIEAGTSSEDIRQRIECILT